MELREWYIIDKDDFTKEEYIKLLTDKINYMALNESKLNETIRKLTTENEILSYRYITAIREIDKLNKKLKMPKELTMSQ